jgi:hypothetical protein
VLVVGTAGFEPATPCSQSRCADQAAPRPVRTASDLRSLLLGGVEAVSIALQHHLTGVLTCCRVGCVAPIGRPLFGARLKASKCGRSGIGPGWPVAGRVEAARLMGTRHLLSLLEHQIEHRGYGWGRTVCSAGPSRPLQRDRGPVHGADLPDTLVGFHDPGPALGAVRLPDPGLRPLGPRSLGPGGRQRGRAPGLGGLQAAPARLRTTCGGSWFGGSRSRRRAAATPRLAEPAGSG